MIYYGIIKLQDDIMIYVCVFCCCVQLCHLRLAGSNTHPDLIMLPGTVVGGPIYV